MGNDDLVGKIVSYLVLLSIILFIYRVGQRKYAALLLRILLTDFQNSFTGTVCRQFAIV